MPKPVIAAVNGFAMGGGLEIALACHLVVADATARFALSEVKVGLIAGAGGLVRLPRTIPPKVATEMILTGRRITAAEALGYGLVNRVTEAGQALAGARALAAEILDGSPTSVRLSLQVMAETRGIPDVIDAVTPPDVRHRRADDQRGHDRGGDGLRRQAPATLAQPLVDARARRPGIAVFESMRIELGERHRATRHAIRDSQTKNNVVPVRYHVRR